MLRMPGSADPIPLKPIGWRVIKRVISDGAASGRRGRGTFATPYLSSPDWKGVLTFVLHVEAMAHPARYITYSNHPHLWQAGELDEAW